MKITKTQLKQIIKEEISKVLSEEQGQQSVSFDTLGTQTTIEFLGKDTPYDQTIYQFRINGQEHEIASTAYDVEDLADSVSYKLVEDDNYWFLNDDYGDEDGAADFKQKLMAALEQLGADPAAHSDARTSYRDRDTGGMY